MAIDKNQDFTTGSISKGMIRFAMPFLLSNILQALYGAVDMWVVGNYSSTDAIVRTAVLSGVNIGSQITHMVAMAVSGLTVAGTVLVGQYIGARKNKDASETVGTMFSLLGLAALVLTAVMTALSSPLLTLLNTPPEAFEHAKEYLNICLVGTIFIFGYNAISSIQRGMGDSVRPLYFVGIACVLNILLDLLLVKGMNMGAAGAAWATVIAQAVSFLIAAVYLGRSRFIFDFKLRSFRICLDKMRMMIKLGIPSSVQSIIVNISFLVMSAVVNSFSVEASAAVGIVSKFNSFAILPTVAMSNSVSAFAAQNIGAGLHQRARKCLNTGIAVAFSISAAIFLLVQLFPQTIISIFDNNPDTIKSGTEYIRTFSIEYLFLPILFCINGLIIGSGHTFFTLISASVSSLFLRIPVAIIFGKWLGWGLTGVGLAGPAATLCSVALAGWFLLSGRWLKDKTGIRRDQEDED